MALKCVALYSYRSYFVYWWGIPNILPVIQFFMFPFLAKLIKLQLKQVLLLWGERSVMGIYSKDSQLSPDEAVEQPRGDD